MNYPIKPWEMANGAGIVNGVNMPSSSSPLYVSNTDRLHSTAIPFPGSGGGSAAAGNQAPPPIPPRPNQTRPIYSAYNRGSMMPYSSYSSPYGVGGYGGGSYGGYGYSSPYSQYSPYSSGGMFGSSPYSSYDQGGDSTFSQLAEESSASAFQSIQSFVNAFGSISMMLESTFHALYSSFRAVVGVADHLGRLKQVLSALAVFRFFKWMFRRVMYLIGISEIKPETIESLWSEVAESMQGSPEDGENIFLKEDPTRPSSWPILMFLGFIFAGPYLMWKLINSLKLNGSQSGVGSKTWATGESEHFIAEAKYSFSAGTDKELNMKSGQTIRVAPAKFQPNDLRGWAVASDGNKIGIVPLNYIKVLGKRSGSGSQATFRPVQIPKQRVRFDLNPRPPDGSCSKAEPTGILVRNENYLKTDNSSVDNISETANTIFNVIDSKAENNSESGNIRVEGDAETT
ncbi:unnamed protein product [Orchesella dallaii]|uniref:Peroxisomal membrane protein PEX13 n=1 Tax=Orchesella dallaii TaxID=48710 RepID=A0ABP1QFN3_9HEXA